jgi:hypothetical protein
VRVHPVLDLTEERTRVHYGTHLEALTGDAESDLEACRTLADRARLDGFRAMLAPSAAQVGERILAIYSEGRAADLWLREGVDRLPVNYGLTALIRNEEW